MSLSLHTAWTNFSVESPASHRSKTQMVGWGSRLRVLNEVGRGQPENLGTWKLALEQVATWFRALLPGWKVKIAPIAWWRFIVQSHLSRTQKSNPALMLYLWMDFDPEKLRRCLITSQSRMGWGAGLQRVDKNYLPPSIQSVQPQWQEDARSACKIRVRSIQYHWLYSSV